MARILSLTLNPALDLTVRLPRLEPGEVNRSDTVLTHAAGKGVNVAQVLADLGHQVTVGIPPCRPRLTGCTRQCCN